MGLKLDLIDKKIMIELDRDCRRPISSIAKELRISQPRFLYRKKLLEKEGIIPFYYALINTSVFGYTFYRVMIRFQSTTFEKEQEIIKELIKNKFVFWIANCSGRFDLIVDIFAKNIVEFDELIRDFLGKNKTYISKREIATLVKSWQFSRAFLLQNKNKIEFKGSYGYNEEIKKIEEKDKEILKIISNNPLTQNMEISDKTGIDRNIIRNKIKKMIGQGVINGFRAWLEIPKLNFQSYKLLIRSDSDTIEKELLDFARLNKHIIYFNKILGDWQYEYDIEVENEGQFYNLFSQIKNEFTDKIKDYEILKIIKNHKLSYCPF